MTGKEEPPPVLRLASASPRRRQLLDLIGVPHVVTPADIDETPHPREAAGDYLPRLAREQGAARARGPPGSGRATGTCRCSPRPPPWWSTTKSSASPSRPRTRRRCCASS